MMTPEKFEVWLCVEGHYCATHPTDKYFCWVMDESKAVMSENAPSQWLPWGHNADLKLVKGAHTHKDSSVSASEGSARRRLLSMASGSLFDEDLSGATFNSAGQLALRQALVSGLIFGLVASSIVVSSIALWLKVQRGKGERQTNERDHAAVPTNAVTSATAAIAGCYHGRCRVDTMQEDKQDKSAAEEAVTEASSSITVRDVEDSDSSCNPIKF